MSEPKGLTFSEEVTFHEDACIAAVGRPLRIKIQKRLTGMQSRVSSFAAVREDGRSSKVVSAFNCIKVVDEIPFNKTT